ncbi:hypothetical protein F8S13_13350 [Chloroflexia bacterium SDU3-3]|nr:hypothetical protein F8S13_13350 [Chloroflexia bacterium SDU3-3]
MTQLIAQIIAALLTVMVLSRIFGDNPFFRVAQYLFVGVSLGLAFVVAYQEVLQRAVLATASNLSATTLTLYAVPLVLGVLLLPRITTDQRYSWLANIPLSLVFGVGAALAAGGAMVGTLVPQIRASAQAAGQDISQIAGVAVLAIGTVAVLCRFYFTTNQKTPVGQLVQRAAVLGHWVLMIAFGFFFASAVQTYLAALSERVRFLITW